MELSGLQAGDVAELMEATAPPGRHGPTIETATTITRDTAGNPLFVCELLRHLAEEHVSYPLGRPDRTRSPVGIRRVVSARVEHLGPGAVTALGAASVCGAEFSIELVTRASGLDKSAVTSLFESAEAARLLAEGGGPGRFVFCHETVRHTLYEDMGGARRAELHADVARLLEEQLLAAPTAGRASSPGQAAGIARHWVASATPEGRSRAVPWLIRAGRDAAASLDPHSARTHFSDALALADGSVSFDETERIDALIGLGTAERQVGEPGFRATLMSAARSARQIGDRRRAVACGLALDRGFVAALGASDPELLGLLEEAREALGDDDPERPVVLAALCQELSFATGLGARRQLGEEAIALADRHGDPAVRARVRIATGYPLLVPEMVDDCRRRSAEAMALAQDLSDPMLEFWAASRRFTTMGLVGDVEEMDRCLAVSGRCASRLDQPVPTWMQGVHEAGRMLLAGDAAGGERRTNEAFAVASSAGQTDALVLLGGQLLLVHWIRGTVSTVAPFAEQMADANPGLPVLQAVKAVVFSDVGRTSEVQELLTRLAEDEYQLPRDPTWLLAMCAYAEAVATCRLVEHAKHLFDELAPWSHLSAFADPVGIGPVSHYLGGLAALLDRVEEADHFLAASAQWCRRVEAPFFAARTDLVWGRLWADHPGPGSATRARDLLDRAIHTSRKHGCAGLVGQADAALARIER